jgi:hypothetical protein
MAQSGMGISVKDYSAMTANTCPSVLASSFLPSPVRSIGTDPVEPVCPSSRSNNATSIVVQTTGSKDKATDDLKKGFEKTSDPGLQEWAAAQLPHFENNKEDIAWRTLKHPGLGLILVGIMAGAICWIGRRKYPAKNSPDFGLRDELPSYSYGGIDADWWPCGSVNTESDSSSDEEGAVAGSAHTDPQLPIVGNLGSAGAPDLQDQAGLIEEQGKDVIESL